MAKHCSQPADAVRHTRSRRALLWLTAALTVLAAASGIAQAAYPERPIRFIIPSAAGGSPDVLMRILTAELSRRLAVPFVIINKPAANYVTGTLEIVKAAPDGYTLGYGNIVSLAINYSLLPSVPYDVERDLTLISNCVRVSNLLVVNNDLPVGSVRELIEYAKRNPDRLVMASAGNGTTGHLGGELFKAMTGAPMLHVPYRGSPQAISGLIAGEAHVLFDNLTSISAYAKAGRVRPLGVSGPQRSPLFPDIPTIAQAGVPGYQTVAWGGIIGPARLPQDIAARLHREIVAALRSPEVRTRFAQLDTVPDGSTPEEFLALARRERSRWAEVIRRAGAKLD
ncbi:MAG TPA: tripartite tricarboxylate transporter substrate binding protein [Burkholderiales bacterium]|jgi:tripartite-type tricarboxylate transporter receptor subunit TctC|nr:tripartite tricarboxylate transporter substrate binding protein [Burkholderiales bacterium]